MHAAGSALYMRYINNAGTVELNTDKRAVSWTDSQSFADTTAGTDSGTSQVTTTYNVTGSIELLDNGTAGSAIQQRLVRGGRGTLEWGTHGTASGQPRYAIIIDIESVDHSGDYNAEQMFTVNWRNQGEWVADYSTLGSTWGS